MKKLLSTICLLVSLPLLAKSTDTLQLEDVFTLEYASNLQVTGNGTEVYFVRNYMDIHSDKKLGNIWKVDKDKNLVPVTSGLHMDYSPALSPDEKKLAFISTASGKPQIHMKWLENGQSAVMTHFSNAPSNISWSPDGKSIAFTQFVPGQSKSVVSLPGKPKGAKWAKPASYIDDVYYRVDGAGYLPAGNTHIFVMSAEGGSARQLTKGEFNHASSLSWSKKGDKIYFSANLDPEGELKPPNSEVYSVSVADGKVTQLTSRNGPDFSPVVSPNGKLIAYLGYDQQKTNYENTQVYLMGIDGSNPRSITADLDRSVAGIQWADNSKSLYIEYDDRGDSVIASLSLKGKRKLITRKMGGQAFGRPYTGGEFDVSANGTVAFTYSDPLRPADIAINHRTKTKVLTSLNEDALAHKTLAEVKEISVKSSFDGRNIQAWVAYPPGYQQGIKDGQSYPLILEIHGGPTTAYGPHFSTEIQLMAAAGYVVVYANPRGSSSYGKEFAQTIHHNYPSNDYDDLMSTVDAVIAAGGIDKKRLYVTGGSGGGVLTAWIIGHTNRFAAAVVAKPVINWYSFVLTADFYPFFASNWFAKKPWEDAEAYMVRSPISYVGNVETPTMLLTGESDYRTPISESEQFYQALKLEKVPAAMVRIPDAGHGIYRRPSNLMSKVAHILWWFDKYNPQENKD